MFQTLGNNAYSLPCVHLPRALGVLRHFSSPCHFNSSIYFTALISQNRLFTWPFLHIGHLSNTYICIDTYTHILCKKHVMKLCEEGLVPHLMSLQCGALLSQGPLEFTFKKNNWIKRESQNGRRPQEEQTGT